MDRNFADILACPVCKGKLRLTVEDEDDEGIYSGTLSCSPCSVDYPIKRGIASLFTPGETPSDLRDIGMAITGRGLEDHAPTAAASLLERDDQSPSTVSTWHGSGFASFKPLVFISHSSRDKADATVLAAELRARGLSVWIDHERIKFGESIPTAIELGLSNSVCALVLVSSSFLSSKWCRAEYEPLLVREIDRDRLLVLPVLLDDCEIPVLLARKRYVDLRRSSHVSRRRQLDELADQVLASTRDESAQPSSKLVETLRHTLTSLSPAELLSAESVKGNMEVGRLLLEEVSGLVERFEEYVDEVASVLAESKVSSRFYGSAGAIDGARLVRANRKLITISREMRSIYQRLDAKFSLSPGAKELIDAVLKRCAQISVVEDFIVIQLLNDREIEATLQSGDLRMRFREAHASNSPDFLQHPVYPDIAGKLMVRDYQLALIELHNYRIALKEAVEDLARAR